MIFVMLNFLILAEHTWTNATTSECMIIALAALTILLNIGCATLHDFVISTLLSICVIFGNDQNDGNDMMVQLGKLANIIMKMSKPALKVFSSYARVFLGCVCGVSVKMFVVGVRMKADRVPAQCIPALEGRGGRVDEGVYPDDNPIDSRQHECDNHRHDEDMDLWNYLHGILITASDHLIMKCLDEKLLV